MIKFGTYATLLSILIMSAVTIWAGTQLPETGQFPVHWNAAGEANGFSNRDGFITMLWGLTALNAAVGLLFAGLPHISPLRQNLMKSSKAYIASWIGMLVIMTFVLLLVVYIVVKSSASIDNKLNVLTITKPINFIVGAFIAILGNYLPKTRRNWFIGIRTPWTLSSNEAWEKTHRLAGTLFVISGILMIISALVLPLNWTIAILISAVSISSIIPIIASFYFWKTATDKQN